MRFEGAREQHRLENQLGSTVSFLVSFLYLSPLLFPLVSERKNIFHCEGSLSPFPTFGSALSHQLYLNNTSISFPFAGIFPFPHNMRKVSHSTGCFHSLTHASLLSQLFSTAIPLGRGADGLHLLIFYCPALSFFFTDFMATHTHTHCCAP